MRNPIIVALDLPTVEMAVELATQVAPAVGAFKIGSELFTAGGPEIVKRLRSTGAAVFLDLKYHDIPNTVSKAVAAACELDIQMLTIHTSGGLAMMQAAEEAARRSAKEQTDPPLVLGVTVLTSMDGHALSELGLDSNVGKQVARLAQLALAADLRGLVCSPLEIATLRSFLPEDVQLVAPGIRSGVEKSDDQKRTLSAREAITAGADWLVVGRPIYAAPNPRAAAEQILASLPA